MENYDSKNYSSTTTATHRQKRWVILACIAATLVAFILVISAVLTQQETTGLQINLSDNTADVALLQSGQKTRQLGKGSRTVQIQPGSYILQATLNNEITTKNITIEEGQSSTVSLSLQSLATPKVVAEYTGKDIYQTGTTTIFLNSRFHTLTSYTAGAYKANVYAPTAYPLIRAYWLNDKQAYVQNDSGDWYYVNNELPALVAGNTKLLNPDNVVFNQSGGIAYVTNDKKLVSFDKPNGKKITIASDLSDNTFISLAANGDVLIYTPKQDYEAEVKPTQLYSASAKQLTTLPTTVQGIGNATWSPDSSLLAYTTSTGMSAYNLKTKVVSTIVLKNISNPNSTTWTDDNRLLYVDGSTIWSYNADNASSTKVADILGAFNNSAFYVDKNLQVYYGTTLEDGKGGNIYSFSAK